MTTQATYPISRNGQLLGRWTIEVLASKLSLGEVSVTDFAWDAKKNDWVTLLDLPELRLHLNSKKPTTPPEDSEWQVTRGQIEFGPFTRLGVVRALQDKQIFEFDLIRKIGTETWFRIAEHEQFNSLSIQALLQELDGKSEKAAVFVQRQHPRLAIENEVLVHDDRNVSSGRMVEASIGGAGLILNNVRLMPGQVVHVHFAGLQDLPAFNAAGEVVSKKYTHLSRTKQTPIQYGLRFVKIGASDEARVHDFLRNKV